METVLLLGALVFFAGWVWFIVAFFKKKSKIVPTLIASIGFLLVVVAGVVLPDIETSTKGKEEVSSDLQKAPAKESDEDLLNVQGNLSTSVESGKIIVDTESNLPDGSLLEVSIVDGNFNAKSDHAVVKDGKSNSIFEIPSEWEPAEFAAMAMFRFNLEEHPQTIDIKRIYGKTGENITGDLAADNNLGGKNATFDKVTIAYPSEEAVKNASGDNFDSAVKEIVESTDGVILDITPRFDDWNAVDIVVGDAWYYTPDHEKERFAEQMGSSVKNAVVNSGKSEGTVLVYFVDSYGADLATPKILGGYKIKK